MNHSFCADQTKQVGEELIGTATNRQTYILIECPGPWISNAFKSKWVPENLSILVDDIKEAKLPVQFLLIANNLSHKVDRATMLIYQRKSGLMNAYSLREFHLEKIEQAATTIKKWLRGETCNYEVETGTTRDILVCTHGSHDKCCARYGNPFYFQAAQTVSKLGLDNVRVWKSSHFGGHRFAPTMIDLPEGRYYGRLQEETFRAVLTRTGDIQNFTKVYRGWGVLPNSLQILERELILRHGWDWFNYQVTGRIIEQSLDSKNVHAEIAIEKPDGSQYTYEAKLALDESKSCEVKSSCSANQKVRFPKYSVVSLWMASRKVVALSTLNSSLSS